MKKKEKKNHEMKMCPICLGADGEQVSDQQDIHEGCASE